MCTTLRFGYNSYGLIIQSAEKITVTFCEPLKKNMYVHYEKVIDPFMLKINFIFFAAQTMIYQLMLISFRAGEGHLGLPLFDMFKLFVLTSIFLVPYHLSKI